MTTEEILNRLRNGESTDSIAQEMTAMLNAAEELRRKEEEEARMQEKANLERINLARNLLNAMTEYLCVVHKNKVDDFKNVTPEDLADAIDFMMEFDIELDGNTLPEGSKEFSFHMHSPVVVEAEKKKEEEASAVNCNKRANVVSDFHDATAKPSNITTTNDNKKYGLLNGTAISDRPPLKCCLDELKDATSRSYQKYIKDTDFDTAMRQFFKEIGL